MAEATNFHPDAAAALELEEAADEYESQRDGLGGEFVAAVRAKIDRIIEAPERYPSFMGRDELSSVASPTPSSTWRMRPTS